MVIKKCIQTVFIIVFANANFALAEDFFINKTELENIIKEAAEDAARRVVTDVLRNKTKIINNQQDKNIYKKLPKQNDTKMLRIGSGAVGGNYFVLGELVGGVISHPKDSLACGNGGTCGLNNLQSQNITSAGSVANIVALKNGINQTGFAQSDITYLAYTGTGQYINKRKFSKLRAIASLYPEAIHIIVRKDANINTVAQLVGKRVSLGSVKSGTLRGARLVLDSYKVSENDMYARYLNSTNGIRALLKGELDAVFFTVGVSSPALIQLFKDSSDFTLLSIGDSQQKYIFRHGHYFTPYTIKANIYRNIPQTKTISVYALWLTTAEANEKLIYALTKALWSKTSKQLFDSSIIGQHITLDNSLKGIGIPLHIGAKKYYREIGKHF